MQNVIDALKNAENAAIIPHVSPDGDAVGAALGLGELLAALGVPYKLYIEEPMPNHLAFLGGAFETFSADTPAAHTAIAVDCGDEGRLGKRVALYEAASVRVCIDHHRTNAGLGDISYINPEASATSEILAELFEAADVPIGKRAAEVLLAGILSDTGGFRFSNTSAKTHKIAAQLMEYGADNAVLCRHLFEEFSLRKLQFEAEIIRTVTIAHGGKTAVAVLTEELFRALDATEEDADGVSAMLRTIAGVETSAVLRAHNGGTKLSMRSGAYVDVAEICRQFGGGGHIRAAGASLPGTPEAWKEKIIARIGESYGRDC